MALRVEKARRWAAPRGSVSFTVTAPVRVVSEMNVRGHWSARKRRFHEQQEAVAACLANLRGAEATAAYLLQTGGTARVTLTRLGGQRLDGDNLASAFKAVRDCVARRLGVDDGDPAVEWEYAQEPGGPEGIRITVEVTAP